MRDGLTSDSGSPWGAAPGEQGYRIPAGVEGAHSLIQAAHAAMKRSYSPYSNFPVGAAVRTLDGHVFSGTNVENASFGLSICAERAAVFAAVNAGHRNFEAMAVVSGRAHPVMPCGACRQVMAEFGLTLHVWLCSQDGKTVETSLAELLPLCFTPADLANDLPDLYPG